MPALSRLLLATTTLVLGACGGPEAPPPTDQQVDAAIGRVTSGLLAGTVVEGRPSSTYSVAERMELYNVPGVSVAVVDGGRIAWARGFGVKDVETSDPVTPATLFQAASISKPLAATGMLRLVEEGLLDLDTPVNTYLTSWQVPDNRFTAAEPVTLRRIVTHNAGLTVHGFPGYAAGEPVPTVPQVLDGTPPANTAAVRVDTFPGAIERYSGGGITVEQLAMTDVTGEAFPALMKRLVLDPAGMTHSTYEQPLPEARRGEEAQAYRSSGAMVEGGWHTYPEMAAAGLWTTSSDLLNWAMAITASRDADGGLLRRTTASDMLTAQFDDYGLGPGLGGEGDGFHFGHGGANEGFRCQVIYFPEIGKGAAVMTNGDGGGTLATEILLAIGAEYGWPDYGPREIDAAALDSASLKAVVGEYGSDQPPVSLTVTREGDMIFGESPGNMARAELVFTSEEVAIELASGTRFRFVRGKDGSVVRIELAGLTLTRR